jgi:hypothetical protein
MHSAQLFARVSEQALHRGIGFKDSAIHIALDDAHGSRIENSAEAAVLITHHAAAFSHGYIPNGHHREFAVLELKSGTTGLNVQGRSVFAPTHELAQVSVWRIARGVAVICQSAGISLRPKTREQLSFEFRWVAMAQ